VHRFTELLGAEVHVAVRRGSGRTARWEHSTTVPCVVTGVRPDEGVVDLEWAGRPARLHLPEDELLRLLAGAGESGSEAWGEPLSDEEAAARFLTLSLEESFGTREAHPSGWWSYDGASGFVPLPPWEAHAQRQPR